MGDHRNEEINYERVIAPLINFRTPQCEAIQFMAREKEELVMIFRREIEENKYAIKILLESAGPWRGAELS